MSDEIFWKPAFEFLYDLGVFEVVLPFILVFTIVFSILEKTQVLGKEKDKSRTKLNSIIALCCGLIIVGTLELANAITFLSKYMALAFVGVMLLAMLAAFLNFGSIENKAFGVAIGIISLGILAILALPAQGLFKLDFLRPLLPWLIIGLFFLVTVWFIIRSKSEEPKKSEEKLNVEKKKEKPKPNSDLELDEDTKQKVLSQMNAMTPEEKIDMLQKASAYEQALMQQMMKGKTKR